ncbi:MAG: hypothetical protein F9K37_04410 [Bacteroidales bacterium]|nr:MAG: hypothetical protein F9K37_04410 [Bacteroidales bacterium]
MFSYFFCFSFSLNSCFFGGFYTSFLLFFTSLLFYLCFSNSTFLCFFLYSLLLFLPGFILSLLFSFLC